MDSVDDRSASTASGILQPDRGVNSSCRQGVNSGCRLKPIWLLRDTIDGDRYPLSPRLRALKGILDKLDLSLVRQLPMAHGGRSMAPSLNAPPARHIGCPFERACPLSAPPMFRHRGPGMSLRTLCSAFKLRALEQLRGSELNRRNAAKLGQNSTGVDNPTGGRFQIGMVEIRWESVADLLRNQHVT
jgi:hypothetical protein